MPPAESTIGNVMELADISENMDFSDLENAILLIPHLYQGIKR